MEEEQQRALRLAEEGPRLTERVESVEMVVVPLVGGSAIGESGGREAGALVDRSIEAYGALTP